MIIKETVASVRNYFSERATEGEFSDCLKIMLDNPDHSYFSKSERVKFINYVEQQLDGSESDASISKRILLLSSLLDPANFKKKIQSMYNNKTLTCFFNTSDPRYHYSRRNFDEDDITIDFLLDSDLLPDLREDDQDTYESIIDSICDRSNGDKLTKIAENGNLEVLRSVILKRQKFLVKVLNSDNKAIQDVCKQSLGTIKNLYQSINFLLHECGKQVAHSNGVSNLRNYTEKYIEDNTPSLIDKDVLVQYINIDADWSHFRHIFSSYCDLSKAIINMASDELLAKMKVYNFSDIESEIEKFLIACINDRKLDFVDKFIVELSYNRVSTLLRHAIEKPTMYVEGTIPVLLKGKPRKFHSSFTERLDNSKEHAEKFLLSYPSDTTGNITRGRASAIAFLKEVPLLYAYQESKINKKVKV